MSLIKKTTTTTEAFYENELLVKQIITTVEEEYSQELTITPYTPIGPSYPWQNPIIYGTGTGTGNPIPNYVDVTCQVEGQVNLFDYKI